MTATLFIYLLADALFYLSERGYDPLAVVAHAALESGWGQSALFESYNNPWGISGCDVTFDTKEYINGEERILKGTFSAYRSLLDAAIDYDRVIKTVYRIAYKHRNEPILYFLALKIEGYATDPYYFQKLMKVYRQLKGGEL